MFSLDIGYNQKDIYLERLDWLTRQPVGLFKPKKEELRR
jgi:hypothetical protein